MRHVFRALLAVALFCASDLAAQSTAEQVTSLTDQGRDLRGSDPALADSLLSEAIRLAIAAGDSAGVAQALIYVGNLRYFEGAFEQAQGLYFRAFDAAEAAGAGGIRAHAMNEMGTLYRRQGDLDKALEYFVQGLEVSRAAADSVQIANSMNNMGIVHDNQGDFEQAMQLFSESADMKRAIGDVNGLTYNLDNMGITSSRLGRFAQAEQYFREGAALREQLGDRLGYAIILNNMAGMFLEMGRTGRALTEYERVLPVSRELAYADFERHILEQMARGFEEQGDWQAALTHHKLERTLADSLFNEERSRQILAMREEFETEQKEQTIVLQEARLEQQSAALQRNYLLLGFAVAALIALGATIALQRARAEARIRAAQTRATIASEDRERKRIAGDLHDGLGQLITTARLSLGTESGSPAVFDEMYDEMRRVAFNLMPAALVRGDLRAALQELAARVQAAGGTVHLHVGPLPDMGPEIRHSVYRIVQEWLSNALKHSGAKEVFVQIHTEQGTLEVTIEDQAPGFDPAILETGSGHGWSNIQARAGAIGGTVRVESTPGRAGTTLHLVATLAEAREAA